MSFLFKEQKQKRCCGGPWWWCMDVWVVGYCVMSILLSSSGCCQFVRPCQLMLVGHHLSRDGYMRVGFNPTNRLLGLLFVVLIDRGLDKWQRLVDKFKFRFYWANLTQELCIGVEITVVVSHQCTLCWVLKVCVVESLKLRCLLVCGNRTTRRWGWSLCLVQILDVTVWSGCRCCWRRSMMWTHWLERLNDWCLGCAVLWLTKGVLKWPWSVDASLSSESLVD